MLSPSTRSRCSLFLRLGLPLVRGVTCRAVNSMIAFYGACFRLLAPNLSCLFLTSFCVPFSFPLQSSVPAVIGRSTSLGLTFLIQFLLHHGCLVLCVPPKLASLDSLFPLNLFRSYAHFEAHIPIGASFDAAPSLLHHQIDIALAFPKNRFVASVFSSP